MNIFQKDCPECAAANSMTARTCRCGYHFEPETASGDAGAYARQQEQLYRDYLAARIVQAEAELTVAREQAKADPENTYKASGALLAEQALNTLQAEMKQLALRVPPRPPARTVPAPPRPLPPTQPAAPKVTAAAKPAPEKRALAAVASAAAAPKGQAAAHVEPPKPQWVTGIRRKTAPVADPTAPAPRPVAKAPPAAAPVAKQVPSVPPAQTAKPDESFRRAQAQKAEAIARSKATKPAQPAIRPVAVTPAVARSAAAPRPAAVFAPKKPSPTQECPNCTATLAADAQRCGCGYAFSHASEQVPALSLDATALAILTEGISALDPTRRR